MRHTRWRNHRRSRPRSRRHQNRHWYQTAMPLVNWSFLLLAPSTCGLLRKERLICSPAPEADATPYFRPREKRRCSMRRSKAS